MKCKNKRNTINTIKTLYDSKSKRNLKSLIKQAQTLDCLSMQLDNNTHYAANIIKDTCFDKEGKKNLVLLEASISFSTLVTLKYKNNYFNKLRCGFYEHDVERTSEEGKQKYSFCEWGLFDSIFHFMKLRKTIYVILDVENYLTYVLSTPVPTYGHHCLMLLFHYDTVQKKYVMNLINPHGQDSKVYHEYLLINKKDTNTVTTYHFDDIVDVAIIKKLLIAFKKYTGKNVLYNPKENTYFGANLQAGDNYGICFIFPILIWYNLGVFYSTDKYVGKRKIKNMKCLLQKNNINKLVESTLAHFTSRTEEFFENNFHKADFTDMLDEYLKQKNNYLTKLMLQRLVGFIGQKAIITKMY